MKTASCAHGPCECQVEPRAKFCSASCESAAAHGGGDCACGHDACTTAEHSIDGNQGEGNREADRRYREGASDFAARSEGRSRR